MDDSRIPKQILYRELSEGTRDVGRPKLRFKDQCKTSMMEFSIDVESWDAITQDPAGWRAAVFTGAKSFEEKEFTARRRGKTETDMPHG